MKPLQIGLLVAAGAIGGAFVVKMVQKPAEPPAVAAQSPPSSSVTTPTPVPAVPEPAAAPVPDVASKPSPLPEKAARKRPMASKPRNEPVTIASSHPAPAQSTVAAAPPAESAPPPPAAKTEPEPPLAPPAPPPAPAPPPPPPTVTLKAGTILQVRLVDGLSSDRSAPGDQFSGTIDQPLVVDGLVIAERGSKVEGRVTGSDKGGRVKGVSSLAIELTKLHTSDGQKIAITTDTFEKAGEQNRGGDAAKIGAAAAIGAAIGAIAGGGKGAAIGAGVGGAAGTGGVLGTRGKAATLPSETRISFRLSAPVTVTERQR